MLKNPQTEQELKEFAQAYELLKLMNNYFKTKDKKYVEQIKKLVGGWE